MLVQLATRDTAHGRVVAFALPPPSDVVGLAALIEALSLAERTPLARYATRRQITYAGGRFAMRRALERVGVDSAASILADDRGAPILPAGVRGSISHKDDVVCAIADKDTRGYIGVDVEDLPGPKDELAGHILTARELTHVAKLAAAERALELSLRFSAKEAIYKALDPYVRRYVGYTEVEVWPKPDGMADVWSQVFPAHTRAEVTWQKLRVHVLTTARVAT